MKRVMTIVIMAVMVFSGVSAVNLDRCEAKAKTDKQVVKTYCDTHYGKPPKYVKEGSNAVKHRKGKSYIVVEHLKTTALGGKWGKTSKGYKVKYTTTTKKGKKVNVYLIYSPKNNAVDDVVAMVDHGKIK